MTPFSALSRGGVSYGQVKPHPVLSSNQLLGAALAGSALFLGVVSVMGGALAYFTLKNPQFTAFKYLKVLKLEGSVALLAGGSALTAGGAVAAFRILLLWRRNVAKGLEQKGDPLVQSHRCCVKEDLRRLSLEELKNKEEEVVDKRKLENAIEAARQKSPLSAAECHYILQQSENRLYFWYLVTEKAIEACERGKAEGVGFEDVTRLPVMYFGEPRFNLDHIVPHLEICDLLLDRVDHMPALKERIGASLTSAHLCFERLQMRIRKNLEQDPEETSVLRKEHIIRAYRIVDQQW